MSSPITFVHITDLHIAHPDLVEHKLFSDTTTKLRSMLSQIKALEPRPSFVAVTGDLTNNGDDASYTALRGILDEFAFDMPLILSLGNHDSREGFNRAFLGKDKDLSAAYFHAQVIDGVHIITLDTTIPKDVAGTITPEQFAWLETELDRHPDLPKLVTFHHPPAFDEDAPDPAKAWMTLPVDVSLRLRDMLAGRSILGILCGHIHHDRISQWYGIPVVVGIGTHFALDVGYLAQGKRYLAASSFALGHIRRSGMTISYVAQPNTLEPIHEMTNAQWAARHAEINARAQVAALETV